MRKEINGMTPLSGDGVFANPGEYIYYFFVSFPSQRSGYAFFLFRETIVV